MHQNVSNLKLDEDGFRHRARISNVNDVNEGDKETNSDEKNFSNSKMISSYTVLSKDVQFLLKVKRYRRKKENEEVDRTNGF